MGVVRVTPGAQAPFSTRCVGLFRSVFPLTVSASPEVLLPFW